MTWSARLPRALGVLACVALAACESSPPGDPGVPGWDGGITVDPPLPPAIPDFGECPEGWQEQIDSATSQVTCDPWPAGDPVDSPQLTPCPVGWREETDRDSAVVTCAPWPDAGRPECAADEAVFPGEQLCSLIGTACSAGDWADDLPDDGTTVHFVLAGAPPGGAGTRASPFGTVAEATDLASAGEIIALSRGTFDEGLELDRGVTLWGACVAETVVARSVGGDFAGSISIRGTDVVVRNLQVGGERPGVYAQGSGSSVHLEEVLINGSRGFGLDAAVNATVTGWNVVIRGTRDMDADRPGMGLRVVLGAQVELERAFIEDNMDVGAFVHGAGSSLSLVDSVAAFNIGDVSGQFGRGLDVEEGGHAEAVRSVFEGNRDVAVYAGGADTTVVLEQVVVQDTLEQESDGVRGYGLSARDGARIDVSQATIEANRGAGAHIHAGGALALTDVVIRDTELAADGRWGRGLNLQSGATAVLERCVVDRNHNAGIFAGEEGTELTLGNTVVARTEGVLEGADYYCPGGTCAGGGGLQVQLGAVADVDRCVLEGNQVVGLNVVDSGSVARLRDVIIRDTWCAGPGDSGRGIQAWLGPTLEAERLLLDGNRDVGIHAGSAGTQLTLTDVVVRNTDSNCDMEGGAGLQARHGAQVAVVRGVFEANREAGFQIATPQTSLTLTDVVIRDTRSHGRDGTGGSGLVVNDGADLDAMRLAVDRNSADGIRVGNAATATLADLCLRDTSADAAEANGTGLLAKFGAKVSVARGLFLRNQGVGILAGAPATEVVLSDVTVGETLEWACADTWCAGSACGTGIVALGGAHVDLVRFRIVENAFCGVQLAHGAELLPDGTVAPFADAGTVDLHLGEVSDNPIGVNVQNSVFDLERLQDHVIYRDNGVNLDMEVQPVPGVAE